MKIKDVVKRTIASNIRRARLAAGMTQADAAKELNITAQAISNFERGINGVENSLLLRMCEIYKTSMSYILGEEYEQEEAPTVSSERSVSDDELMFALWGDCQDIDEDDLEDVRRYAAFVRERKKGRK